jgi:hypothetical protein
LSHALKLASIAVTKSEVASEAALIARRKLEALRRSLAQGKVERAVEPDAYDYDPDPSDYYDPDPPDEDGPDEDFDPEAYDDGPDEEPPDDGPDGEPPDDGPDEEPE